jgi:predicted house-cleaning noncanonical NTP pyrophosphatase (MazG superfamily)
VLEGEDFDRALRAKLVEEAQEVAGADTREALMREWAYVVEGVESRISWHGTGNAAVRAVQIARRRELGRI